MVSSCLSVNRDGFEALRDVSRVAIIYPLGTR
jgi:hypothetical protein